MRAHADIPAAAEALRRGELVAFPTETVYGLGADAGSEAAVRRVFEVKGRPADHPLIVHVESAAQLDGLAARIPPAARLLAERAWPGPLTLVLERDPRVLDVVTGGLPTVAVRVPAHELAHELLRAFGGPIAAPSANRFGSVSPTTADHVVGDLGDAVAVVLDGGACPLGLESTIVDVTPPAGPRILRPGGLPRETVEAILGRAVPVAGAAAGVRAPGRLASHYAPHAEVLLLPEPEWPAAACRLLAAGRSVGALATSACSDLPPEVLLIPLPRDAGAAAPRLYAALREADGRGLECVLAAPFDEAGLGLALDDRLRKAAGPRPAEAARPHAEAMGT